MDPALVGAIGGLMLGLGNFGVLRWVADMMERQAQRQQGVAVRPSGALEPAALVRWIALLEIPVFVVVGYLVGPLVFTAG